MKHIILTATAVLSSTAAFAGNLVEPMMEPEVVEAATTSSGGGLLIPILLLILLAAAVSSGGSDPVSGGCGDGGGQINF